MFSMAYLVLGMALHHPVPTLEFWELQRYKHFPHYPVGRLEGFVHFSDWSDRCVSLKEGTQVWRSSARTPVFPWKGVSSACAKASLLQAGLAREALGLSFLHLPTCARPWFQALVRNTPASQVEFAL